MSAAALIPAPAQYLGNPAPVAEQAREYARRARSAATIRAYKTDWADFEAWCGQQPASALPATPETVACYISSMADHHKASTIQRRLSAISQVHQVKGFESPTKGLSRNNMAIVVGY
jgi:site-specific recombinase XerD